MHLPEWARTASFRLAAGYAGLFAVSALLLGGLVYFVVNSTLDRHRQVRIDAEIAFLESKYRSEGIAELTDEVEERLATSLANGLDYLVVGADGAPLAGNLPFVPEATGWTDVDYPRTPPQVGVDHIRLHIVDLEGAIRLAVGDDSGPALEIHRAVANATGWFMLAFGLIGVIGGAFVSAAFLKRVEAVRRTADAIISGDLNERMPIRGTDDDFDRLSASLNRMLDRIGDLMESLRQVSNDIAHNLRTPLTRLRQRLEGVRDNETAVNKRREELTAAVAEIDSILETFSALLRIAQVGAGQRAGFRRIDLSDLFATVCEAFAPAAEDDGKTLAAQIEPGLKFVGDPELLTQMLANVMENALQYTPKGTRIVVTLQRAGTEILANVADNGPGVPEDERGRIFGRFYRLPRDKLTPGIGLGLAVVAAIAGLHGIEVVAEDNAPGLRVVFRFKSRAADS